MHEVTVSFRALPVWPHTATHNRRSRWSFKAGWQDTLDMLKRELRLMGAKDVVIAAGFQEHEIRQDGMPRGNARVPSHPGVEISFDLPAAKNPTTTRGRQLINHYGGVKEALRRTHPDVGGDAEDFKAVQAATEDQRMAFATDEYETWQHNVRAIALTLTALRAIDRYGATQGRQYAGFTRHLTAGSST